MLNEKLGGINRKSYARNDSAAQTSAGPRLLRTATSNTAARNTSDIARLKAKFVGASLDERDGLRLSWPGKWLHLRASNTEPILRAIAEASNEIEARELCRAAEEVL